MATSRFFCCSLRAARNVLRTNVKSVGRSMLIVDRQNRGIFTQIHFNSQYYPSGVQIRQKKTKTKKEKKAATVSESDTEVDLDDILDIEKVEDQMKRFESGLAKELSNIRSGTADAGIFKFFPNVL